MAPIHLPQNHPQRFLINDEVHARPTESLSAPARLSYLVLVPDPNAGDDTWKPVADLARRFDISGPDPGTNHFRADLGPVRLKWEKHTEFVRYTFVTDGTDAGAPFGKSALDDVPAEWIAGLRGQTIVAAHAALLRDETPDGYGDIATQVFDGDQAVGSAVAGGAGVALTDFHIKSDSFSRLLVVNGSMSDSQAGRVVQRLLEIDTYRIMALLTLPVARGLTPFLAESEAELVSVMSAMSGAREQDEPDLLARLIRLEADIETRYSNSHSRFSAAAAYYGLVQRRIRELREQRIQGLQTFGEFTERRLAPAMNTCRAISDRQEALSQRVARATQLLSTRVDISRESQNQALLESMNRRAKLQLRLQQTVEGLSVAAITYYIVGLVGYAAKGLKDLGAETYPDLAMAISIPIVALLVAFGVRRIRHVVTSSDKRRQAPDL